MAKSATHFQPTTDTFGELTFHARRLGARFLTADWTGVRSGVDRRSLINLLSGIAFVLAFVTFLAGIAIVDQSMFTAKQDTASQTYYGGVPLDYD